MKSQDIVSLNFHRAPISKLFKNSCLEIEISSGLGINGIYLFYYIWSNYFKIHLTPSLFGGESLGALLPIGFSLTYFFLSLISRRISRPVKNEVNMKQNSTSTITIGAVLTINNFLKSLSVNLIASLVLPSFYFPLKRNLPL